MSDESRSAPFPREWDAASYHRVADPQFAWGVRVLDRIALTGGESALDAGCGSGRLTAELLARLPEGRVVALDRSENMLAEARAHLLPRFEGRVSFVAADLLAHVATPPVDLIFSTATFHWVLDHPRLFANLFASLHPGGRLVAQCGGGDNLARVHVRAAALMASPRYAPSFVGWTDPWEFADAETTAARLSAAGFVDIETELALAPTTFADAEALRRFLTTVVLRVHLARIDDLGARAAFVDALVDEAAGDDPPYTLDYVRLNMSARRP